VKVIDMTGPEQRVLSGYHAIAGQRPTEEWDQGKKERVFRTFNLPELLHNLDLLVKMSEQVCNFKVENINFLLTNYFKGYSRR
jgi:tuftelin-interacting protein 11